MANQASSNISPSQKNSSSVHNLPARSSGGRELQAQREAGTGESAVGLNKQIMPIHKGKQAFNKRRRSGWA